MQKTKQSSSRVLYLLATFTLLIVFLLTVHHSSAASPTFPVPNTFIQSYSTSANLQNGMIVQLAKGDATSVIPASQDNIYGTFGIIVNSANAAIAIQDSTKTGSAVFVANNGHYNVLVSDQNGPISAGNYLTVSSLDGIAMKTNSSAPIVIAQALASFNNSSPIISTEKIKTSSGTVTVHIGLVSSNISIGHNPLLVSSNSGVPRVLEQFSRTITGKSVTAWRIWLGVSVIAIASIMAGTMLYGAARSSLISIGRNPLSKKAITKGFIQVVLLALIIFISSVFGVYLLLKV